MLNEKVAAKYPLSSSIWASINLYMGYILILPVCPQASLGLCLNKTSLASFSLSFSSASLCFLVFFSLSLTPHFLQPPFVYPLSPFIVLCQWGDHHYSSTSHIFPRSSEFQGILTVLEDSLGTCSRHKILFGNELPQWHYQFLVTDLAMLVSYANFPHH